MKLVKFIHAVVVVVLVLLVYVRQRVELLKVGYEVRSKEVAYLDLLDQNRILDYNVNTLSSPSKLERFLKATNKKYRIASRREILQLNREPQEAPSVRALDSSGKRALAGLLSLKAQAEATMVNK